jgi:hypothetical protein
MARKNIRNGQAEYGTVHLMEEEMREAEQGVFEKSSTEPSVKAKGAAPANKARKAAPTNKAAPRKRKAK